MDVRNSRIVLNSSHGISCLDGANATVRGCLIANNQGGGVCVGKNSRIRMFENLIALNTGLDLPYGAVLTEKLFGARFEKTRTLAWTFLV